MCDTERPKESGVAQTGTGILTLYQAAEEVKPWTCEACTMQNESKDNKCTMCGTAKASNTPALALPLALPAPTVSHEATSPVASNWLEKKSIVHEMLKSGLADIRLEEEVWETTCGLMYITYGDIFVGDIVHGDYFDSDGSLCGVLRISEDKQRMELRAKYKAAVVAQENTCFLNFNAQERLEGYWYRGDGSGVWLCKYVEANKDFRGLTDKAPFHSGLVNMQQGLTNVCYQNSFLQALFMTQAFRDQILACDKPTNPILKTLQDLFSKLLLTHNPSLATHDLQKCLLSSFQAGRQQDVCDFAHFLVDNLSNGFEEQLTRLLGGTQATIIRCKSAECQHISVTREYFWELLLNMVDLRYTPITSICGVHGSSLKIPAPRKYDRLNYDLNKDRTGAPYLFLCVQRDVNADPITDIMVKVVDANEAKPTLSGYTRVEMDLNMGLGSSGGASPSKKNSPGTSTTEIRPNKKQIYLFYSKDPSGSPITDLTVIYGQDTVPDGFKVIRVDLNQGEGTKVFLCYRCDMPVTDIKLVSEGLPGYKLIDRPLQLGGKQQFLAHTDGGSLPCITSLCLIDSDEVKAKEATNWEKLNFLNDSQQHLMIQRGQGNPLYAVEVFRSPQMVPKYSDYETITLVGPKEAEQISLETLHGEWKAGDDCERSKRTVQIHHVGRNLSPSFKVTASFSKRGILQGVLQSYQAQTHVLWGSWQDSTTKHPQLVHLLFQGTNMEGTIGDGKAKCANIRGSQVSKAVSILRPISDVFIARDGDISSLLDGMEVVSKIYSDLHLVVRRDDSECPVKEIGVIYGDIDPIPEGYECINTTIGGFNANVNQGGNVPIYICYKRDGTSALALSNISILTTSEVPDGYTKVQHTPLGMEATLVQGKSIYLSYQRLESSTPQQLLDHVLNGQYDTTMWGRMNFMVLSSIVTNEVMANCNVTAHGSSPPTVMRGLAYEVSPTMIKCVGLWEPAGTQTLLTYNGHLPQNSNVFPFELDFSIDESSKIPSTQGWWSQQNESGKWNLVKDCYVHLAYKKDYGSEWANGKLICSERVSEHSVSSMLERFGSLRTLGGEFTCSGCHQRTESSVHSVVVTPPAHLILTLKRMHYDWKLQKTCKSLHDVSFQAYLQLPALSDADRSVLKIEEGQVEPPRAYGLYGVLVHSGVSANSGHYYSFCRSSASANLFLEDDPSAPWIKFNDTNVTTSSWAEMNSCVETSVSDSVYLLFYKRLDHMKPDLEEEVKSEDEEAMLLAKAMALSMSSQEAVLDSFSSSTNVLFENIQQDNSKFLLQTVANRSSQASLEELHSYLRLQNNIEEPFWTAIKSMVG
ncbi:hypothetical protein LEN26_016247 [Aphanomyces euteiches]|nr:hypothetical protein LEN26_016247 [Aphanomyces euteiches]